MRFSDSLDNLSKLYAVILEYVGVLAFLLMGQPVAGGQPGPLLCGFLAGRGGPCPAGEGRDYTGRTALPKPWTYG